MSDQAGDESAVLSPTVRIRSRWWLRVVSPLLTAGAIALAVAGFSGHSTVAPRPLLAIALVVLCGLVTAVAWWGEVAIDGQRFAARVVQRDGSQVLAVPLIRIVGLNRAPWWRGGSTLVVQDATGRTIALGGGYFPLRKVWRVLGPHLEGHPDIVIHPSMRELAPSS